MWCRLGPVLEEYIQILNNYQNFLIHHVSQSLKSSEKILMSQP